MSPRQGRSGYVAGHQRERHVHKAPAPTRDGGLGATGHRRVDRCMSQSQAVDTVVGVGSDAADRVARVDVPNRGRPAGPREVGDDAVLEHIRDVAQLEIARRISGATIRLS